MSKIIKQLEILGDKGISKAEILLDSGANSSVGRMEVAEKVSTIIKLPKPRRFFLADGKTAVETDLVANIMITINGVTIDDIFYVVKELGREIIIGASTMQKWDIKLNLKDEQIIVGQDPNNIELFSVIRG